MSVGAAPCIVLPDHTSSYSGAVCITEICTSVLVVVLLAVVVVLLVVVLCINITLILQNSIDITGYVLFLIYLDIYRPKAIQPISVLLVTPNNNDTQFSIRPS